MIGHRRPVRGDTRVNPEPGPAPPLFDGPLARVHAVGARRTPQQLAASSTSSTNLLYSGHSSRERWICLIMKR